MVSRPSLSPNRSHRKAPRFEGYQYYLYDWVSSRLSSQYSCPSWSSSPSVSKNLKICSSWREAAISSPYPILFSIWNHQITISYHTTACLVSSILPPFHWQTSAREGILHVIRCCLYIRHPLPMYHHASLHHHCRPVSKTIHTFFLRAASTSSILASVTLILSSDLVFIANIVVIQMIWVMLSRKAGLMACQQP